jgi:hypothetical protein
LPLELRGGRAVASWSHWFDGNRMLVTVTPFEPDALTPHLCARALDDVGHLLGASAVQVAVAVPAP